MGKQAFPHLLSSLLPTKLDFQKHSGRHELDEGASYCTITSAEY